MSKGVWLVPTFLFEKLATMQYANEHGSDSARFEHGGGSRSNMKGEYVFLTCQKHYLPT